MTNKQTKSGSYYEKVQNPSQVDAYIGTSYDVVKEVYNNLEAIRKVESAIDDISVIAKDVTNGDYISDMERIDDQFLAVDQQLVNTNTRIDSNATDISNLSTLTTQITNNINVLDNEVSLIDSKVEQSKQDISTVQGDISSISTDIDLLNTRLTNEENKTVVDTTARANAANAQSKADSNEAEIATLKSDIENISIEANLSTTTTATEVTINSDTGTDATINPATSSNAGLMTPEQYSKLDGLSSYDDSELSTRVSENESDITNLQDQANSNNSSINQITDNITMIDSRVTNLENAGGTGGGTSYIERQLYDPSNSVGSGVIHKNDPDASRVDITFKDITESVHIESDLLFDCKDLDVFNFIGDTGSVINIGMDFNNLMNVGVELPYSITEGDIMTVTILDVSKGIIKAEVKSVYEYDEDIPSSQIRAMITALEEKDVSIESNVNAIDTRLTTAESNITSNDTDISNLTDKQVLDDTNTNARIDATNLNVSNLSTQVSNNDTDIASLQAKDVVLEADITALQNKDTLLDSDIAALDTRVAGNELNIDSITVDIGTINTNVADHETRISAIEAETDIVVVDSLTSVSTTDALSANQGKVLKDAQDAIDVRLTAEENKEVIDSTARASATNAQAKADANEIDISDLTNRVTTAETNITSNDTDIASLDGRVSTLEAGGGLTVVDNLTSTSATDALSANQGKILNEKIDAEVASIDTDIANLDVRVSSLDNRVSQNETDIATLPASGNSNIVGQVFKVGSGTDLSSKGFVNIKKDLIIPKSECNQDFIDAYSVNEGVTMGLKTKHTFPHDQSFQITESGIVAYLNVGYTRNTNELFFCNSWADETQIHSITFNDVPSSSSKDTALIGRVRYDEETRLSFIYVGYYDGSNSYILTVSFDQNDFLSTIKSESTMITNINGYHDDRITITNNFMIFEDEYVGFNPDGTPNFSNVYTLPPNISALNLSYRTAFTMNDMLFYPKNENFSDRLQCYMLNSEMEDRVNDIYCDSQVHCFTTGIGSRQKNYISTVNKEDQIFYFAEVNNVGDQFVEIEYNSLVEKSFKSSSEYISFYSVGVLDDIIVNGSGTYKYLKTESSFNYFDKNTNEFSDIYDKYSDVGNLMGAYQNNLRGNSFTHYIDKDTFTMFVNGGSKHVIEKNILSPGDVLVRGIPDDQDKTHWVYKGE